MKFNVVNLDDANVVLDEVVVAAVYVIVVANLLDDEVVEVDVVDVLDSVDVVVNFIDIVVDAMYDDLDVSAVPIVFVSELLVSNGDVDDVNVDGFVHVVGIVLPVGVVVELLVGEVVVDDVGVELFSKLSMTMITMLLL